MAATRPGVIHADYQQTVNLEIPQRPFPLESGLVAIALARPIMPGSVVRVVPEIPTAPAIPGTERIRTFHGWYYRIHVVPTAVQLGSVTSDQTRQVYLWNADFVSKTIESTVLNGDAGLSLASPVTPPAPIGPLQSLYYLLTIDAEGAASISGTITWVINGRPYVVPINGRRRVLFSFGPNWAAAVTDTLTWATTVNTVWSGREQRNKIARQPRRALRYTTRILRSEVTQQYDSATFGWQGRLYLVPLWQEASRLNNPIVSGATILSVDTEGMTLELGCPVLLYRDALHTEMNEVLAYSSSSITLRGPVAQDWPRGTKVMPCIDGIPLGSFSATRQVPTHIDVAVAFTANPVSGMLRVETPAAPVTYRNEEAYYTETDWANGINTPLAPNALQVDSGSATIELSRKGEFPAMGRSFRWVAKTRQQANLLRQFFARRCGRFRAVWLPSGTDDFTLLEPLNTVTATVVVRNLEYPSLVQLQSTRRDIVFLLRDGTALPRRIVGAIQGPDSTVLTLDAGFDQGVRPEEIKRVSYLGLYRLAEDYVTFNWTTDRLTIVETNFVMTDPSA